MDELYTDLMRKVSKDSHSRSDKIITAKLVLVLQSRKLYGLSISLFASIYEYLESALEKYREHPQLHHLSRLILQNDIRRTERFKEDIFFYLGNNQNHIEQHNNDDNNTKMMLIELQNYLKHLERIEREDPVILVAYVYHMYMALLAGGFIIRAIVQTRFRLNTDAGVMSLTFSNEKKAFRSKLKRCVNHELNLSIEQKKRILEESVKLYSLNNTLACSVQTTSAFQHLSRMVNILSIIILAVILTVAIVIAFNYSKITKMWT